MLKKVALQQDKTAPALPSQKILEALQGIRYGAVEIVIHDGRVVQIERREKLRLDVDGRASPG